jgi:hypothetical protein
MAQPPPSDLHNVHRRKSPGRSLLYVPHHFRAALGGRRRHGHPLRKTASVQILAYQEPPLNELAGIQAVYRRDGLAATFTEVAKVLGIDPVGQEVEPEVPPHPMTPQRIADFGFSHPGRLIMKTTI